MIVRSSSEGIHIIYQAAHGLLAGKIGQELQIRLRPTLWFETLVAIVEHDDQQLNFKEKRYVSEVGLPMDFTEYDVRVQDSILRAKRVIKQAKSKSLWTALLVSYHLDFLYGSLGKKFKEAERFLRDQQLFRKKVLSHFGISNDRAKAAYDLLRFCDRCSLVLCKDEIPDAGREVEINTSIENETYYLKKSENNELTVAPWCFQKSSFELTVEETVLKTTQFKSQLAFKKYLRNQERRSLIWKFRK